MSGIREGRADAREAETPSFTPGPWRTRAGDSVVHIEARGQSIAITYTKAYYERHDQTDVANATLMSAAPEMYGVLKAIWDCYGFGGTAEQFVQRVSPLIDQAALVMAKARGTYPASETSGPTQQQDSGER